MRQDGAGKTWAGWILPALLTACVPPSPNFPKDAAPRLETDMDLVFDERPVWEDRPVMAEASAAKAGVHIVQAGDTGIGIARAYAVPWSRIIAANDLTEPFILKIGQKIKIPGAAEPQAPANAPTMEDRAAAFRINIDDILTGGEPAQASGAAPSPALGKPLPPSVAVREPGRFIGNFVWPVRGTLATRFGPAGEGEVNQGIEIATAPAAPIVASSDGVVAFVGNNVAGFGGMILIRHGEGWITAYGRAARTTVTRGQSVKRGDVIGNTGTGSAPKLYFEMRKNRVPVDPLKQVSAPS